MTDLSDIAVLRFESIDSTNEEALRRLAAGVAPPFWVVSAEQTTGRGRSGRRWQSPAGNLYATLALETSVSASVATQLSFVAGLAVHDAAAAYLSPDELSRLRLKWPNDVLLGTAKLAGILLESLTSPRSQKLTVVLGFGINVAHAPDAGDREVASLGLKPSAVPQVFGTLAVSLETCLELWDEGRGFPAIREAWLGRALALDQSISVNLNGSAIRGKFRGVDAAGALQLETGPGVVITITAGDIYLDAPA